MPPSFAEQHADLAAFLWARRDLAVRAPHHDLDTLTDLDERVEANLDGLRVAGERGTAAAAAALDEGELGTLFVAAVLALDAEDRKALAALLDRVAGDGGLARELVSAIGWVSMETAAPVLGGLLAARAPLLRKLGLAGSAAHRRDPGAALVQGLLHEDVGVRARALRAAGELGRADVLGDVRAELGSSDETCRFWAAWSGALLGDEAAVPVLATFAHGEGPRAERACDLAVRRMRIGDARALVEGLREVCPRTAFVGAAALGDPAVVPWLLDDMAVPERARAAGEAFTAISGMHVLGPLRGKAPEGFEAGPSDDPAEDEVAMDPDQHLGWPDVAAVRRVWEARAGALRAGARYLLGKPVEMAWLAEVLRGGKQRQRAGAAVEMSIARGGVLFEVRARGERQRERLEVRA